MIDDIDKTISYSGSLNYPLLQSSVRGEIRTYYLYRQYEKLIFQNSAIQERLDDALVTLDAAQSRIEELEEELVRVEVARLAQMNDYEQTIYDFEMGTGRR